MQGNIEIRCNRVSLAIYFILIVLHGRYNINFHYNNMIQNKYMLNIEARRINSRLCSLAVKYNKLVAKQTGRRLQCRLAPERLPRLFCTSAELPLLLLGMFPPSWDSTRNGVILFPEIENDMSLGVTLFLNFRATNPKNLNCLIKV